MKKSYTASLTIASLLLPTFLATQTGLAAEGEGAVPETVQTVEAAPEPTPAPPITVPEQAPEVKPVEEPAAPVQEAAPVVTEAPQTPTAPPEEAQSQPAAAAPTAVAPQDVEEFPSNEATDTAPAINIIPVQTITKGSAFDPMAGVSATDKTDGDITSKVTVSGTVNVNVEGDYLLTYSVTNAKGQTTTQFAHIMVVAPDVGMYTIELPDFSLPKGADYVQAIRERVVIKDVDGTIIPTVDADIVVSGFHSTDKVGKIAVEVAVLSPYNTITKKIVTITIEDKSAVRIDAKNLTLKVGDSFDPYSYAKGYETDVAGVEKALGKAATASDTGVFVTANTVDTKKAGTYTVTYQVRGASGKVATQTITVVVEDKKVRLPNILVEDKVMYVGEKLTEDIIFSWAKTENPDDFITEFEVLNDEIVVYASDDTLVEEGVYTIQFTAVTPEGETAKKSMTLTVVDISTPAYEPPADQPSKGINSGGNKNIQITKNVVVKKYEQLGAVKPTTKKTLPSTGETKNSSMISVLGMVMSIGVLALFLKKKKAE